jgi:hypothetical protein
MAKAQGIELILIQAPVTKATYKAYTNNQFFDEEMKKYGPYLNFNERINLNDSLDFFDGHHLNQNGVVKFNKALMEELFSFD